MKWIKKLFGLQPASVPTQAGTASKRPEPSTPEELTARYGHLYRPALQLIPSQASDGFSRLGGLPLMPGNLEWPVWKEKPQAFLAQLSLAELHAALPSFLPASGFLYFFYDKDQGVWGFDPADLGGWRVLYVPDDGNDLVERAAPEGLGAEFIYQGTPVTPQRIELLPDAQSLSQPEFEWERDGEAYSQLRHSALGDFHYHQVHGYPTPVQDAGMEEQCHLAFNGIQVGNAEGSKDPRVPGLKAGAKDWKLLLQLDTDDEAGWMWGDVGTLYFWVREQDARAGDFSKVWMVFQCC